MATKKTVVALMSLLTASVLQDACALELTITPGRAHVQPGQRVKVMCQADAPLVGCQFKRIFSPTLYELSRGTNTSYMREYSYYGTGLANGQCGISLTEYVREHTYDLIACRARAANGAWHYAQMSLVINSNSSYLLSISPSRPVVPPGGNVTILCQADQPISGCLFKWNNQSWIGLNETVANAQYQHAGAGIERGQCGVTFLNATHALSGDVFCSAWTKARPKGYEAATVPLVVAALPNPPTLTLANASLPADAILSASCVIRQARPAPLVTWLLDGDVIGQDACGAGAGADAPWRWPHEARDCEATLALPVAWRDDGKDLVCRVQHVALPGGRVDVAKVVDVTYAPRGPLSPIQLFGFAMRGAAEVAVHVWANPRPAFVWTVANQSLSEGNGTQDGRLQALTAFRWRDKCGWQAKLFISSLSLADLESEVHLTATNALGSADFRLQLHLTPAPDVAQTESSVDECASRVQHVHEANVTSTSTHAPEAKEARSDRIENTQGGDCHTGLSIALLLLVALVAVAATWYTRSKGLWCFGKRQFARSSLAEEAGFAEDTSGMLL